MKQQTAQARRRQNQLIAKWTFYFRLRISIQNQSATAKNMIATFNSNQPYFGSLVWINKTPAPTKSANPNIAKMTAKNLVGRWRISGGISISTNGLKQPSPRSRLA